MVRSRRWTTLVLSAVLLILLAGVRALNAPPAAGETFGFQDLTPRQKRLVSGTLALELGGVGAAGNTAGRAGDRPATARSAACAASRGSNIKVNQNCVNDADPDLHGRGQAQNETWMAADPNDPRHLIATYNDYRRGDGTCGVSYSHDGGRHWADATLPNGFTRGTAYGGKPRQYWQGGGDPSVAFDSRGNAYFSCLAFNRGLATSPHPDQSSAHFVFRSTGTAGASWNFPGRPVAEHADTAGAGGFLLDKQFMAVDANPRSPFRDRVYVTWTTFAADGTAYIYGAHSADYAEHFSAPVLISADSGLCANTFGLPTPRGRCNTNQFSQPFVGPDGTLYVVFANYNNAVSGGDNRNQMLLVRSTDGGATFSAPVKAGDFYDFPDCATYQAGRNPGRGCIPEKGPTTDSVFRAANYPLGAVDPRDPRRVVVGYGSYIGRNSNETNGCTPAGFAPATGINLYTGVKDGSCNNDILLSVSADGGRTFTGTATDPRALPVLSNAPAQARTSQFFHGLAYSPRGTLVTTYYDRGYGSDERTGYSDLTVTLPAAPARFRHVRVTTSSMPPPTQFDGVFFGDYIQLAVTARHAYPLWPDTRNPAPVLCAGTGTATVPPRLCAGVTPTGATTNDQEIFTAAVPLPR
jgi:hypothetical protein